MPEKLQKQRIVFPIAEFLVTNGNDARGAWSGYANTLGFLENNYGSIFVSGCYQASIPSFLKDGFVPDSHGAAAGFEYTVLGSYGYPTAAREDMKGLYFEGAFHSDAESQTMRTRIAERSSAGKSVGMSIGFLTTQGFRILPKDYASELPKYLAPEHLKQGLEDAKNWASILIRQRVQLIECSLTLTPANTDSLVTEVQTTMEHQGKFLDIDESLALSQVAVILNAIGWDYGYRCFCDELTPMEERRVIWDGVWTDAHAYALKIFDAYSNSELSEEPGEEVMSQSEKVEIAKAFFRSSFANPTEMGPLAGFTLKQSRERALAAVQSYTQRVETLASKREAERLSGKAVSKANWESHKALRDALDDELKSHTKTLKECIGKMDDFLDKHNPDAEQQSRRKELDTILLRSQIRSLVTT